MGILSAPPEIHTANLLRKGMLTTLDFPGAFSLTQPQGINSKGEIVGFWDDGNGQFHGFRLAAGIFSTVDVPNAFDTECAGVNEAGQIVGVTTCQGCAPSSLCPASEGSPKLEL